MLGAAVITVLGLTFWGIKYSYEPPPEKVLSRSRPSPEAYDLWGGTFSEQQASSLQRTDEGRAQLAAQNGAVKVDDALLRLGRRAFCKETFGNEIFLSDVMGILDGPL